MDWSDYALFASELDFTDASSSIDITKRGFTDHEHLDEMQLIHMNGRMYDYNNGRFLSVDPFIQNPTSTQSLNPYTYIFNNPLSGTDPSGYVAKDELEDVTVTPATKIDVTGSRLGLSAATAIIGVHTPSMLNRLDSATTKGSSTKSAGGTSNIGEQTKIEFTPSKDTQLAQNDNHCDVLICDENGHDISRSLYSGIKPAQEKAKPVIDAVDAVTTPSVWDFVPIVGASKKLNKVNNVRKKVNGKVDNSVIGKPRTGSANKLPDGQHGFNDIIDNYAGDAAKFDIPTKGPGGKVVRTSELRQIEGSNNGIDGVYEWIIDQGNVTHRRFIPGGTVTGVPNQIPKK